MANTYEAIASTTLASSGTFSFSSIPQTYTDLVVIVACVGSGTANLTMNFNSDSGSNYYGNLLYGNESSLAHATNTTAGTIYWGICFNGTWTLNTMSIQDYTNTTRFKNVISKAGGATSSEYQARYDVQTWRSTSAINAIGISGNGINFAAGSMATLYGIKAA